jgi:uncharacterized protein involved in tolerance to divalent cations
MGVFLIPVECESDWVQYKHKCVKYFNQKVEFEVAEKICESNNANLISIHSAEENEFIRSYVKKHPSYSTKSLEFFWIDKSPVDYVNWGINQPDNNGGLEPYIEMLIDENGMWNDVYHANFAFVCGFNCKLSIKISE